MKDKNRKAMFAKKNDGVSSKSVKKANRNELLKNWSSDLPDKESEYYSEYKKLGGKQKKSQYRKNLNIFLDETYDIYIDGNPDKHESRDDANWAVIKKAGISVKEFNLIFDSVDNVDGYT